MNAQLSLRKLLTIVCEADLETLVVRDLKALGARGYTITDARGDDDALLARSLTGRLVVGDGIFRDAVVARGRPLRCEERIVRGRQSGGETGTDFRLEDLGRGVGGAGVNNRLDDGGCTELIDGSECRFVGRRRRRSGCAAKRRCDLGKNCPDCWIGVWSYADRVGKAVGRKGASVKDVIKGSRAGARRGLRHCTGIYSIYAAWTGRA